MSDYTALRAAAATDRSRQQQRSALPTGERSRGAPGQHTVFPSPPQFRAEMVARPEDGLNYFLVEGYASRTETPYEMWDMFGPYREVIARTAFDVTLATKPDVVFRFNHGGTPMANTNDNKRLELWADSLGLGTRAYLNPKRADVQELIHAIEDKDVREQSFMFQIEDGQWSEDYTEYRITEVDMDRGDVGPVTYGANPETVIAARSLGAVMAAIPDLSPTVAREMKNLLDARDDLKPPPAQRAGTSVHLALARLEIDRETA